MGLQDGVGWNLAEGFRKGEEAVCGVYVVEGWSALLFSRNGGACAVDQGRQGWRLDGEWRVRK